MSFESRHFGWSFKEGLTVIDLSQFVQVLFVGIIFAAIKYWSEMSHVSTPLPVGCKGYMPTLPDHLGVSRIWHQSPGLLYRSPNFPDKIELWAFLCFNLKISHFLPKFKFSLIHSSVSGAFLHVFNDWERLFHQYNHKSELWWSVPRVRLHIMS